MQDKRKTTKRVASKKTIPMEPESQEQSSEFENDHSDDISELIDVLKHKFTKKNAENQKQLENEVDERATELCNHMNDVFKSNEAAM